MLTHILLYIPEAKKPLALRWFQRLCDRLTMGEFRYGAAGPNGRYWSRLKLELRAYNKTGNEEHLLNIANYCMLEAKFPEHKKHHWNPTVESATRGKLK